MLPLFIESREVWDENKQEFVEVRGGNLILEHSLLSISKWESKFHKPFLSNVASTTKTPEEMMYYIECMTINNVSPDIYYGLTNEHIKEISNYISDTMTATTITNRSGKRNNKIVTSELIYCWMTMHNIPFECQKWHLNRLMTLIQVCNIENSSPQKMSKRDVMNQNRALNAARRAKHHSKG